ncbi:hypothetical protein IAR50_006209 [Cryptococcus sp. DSM 104548]
MAAVAQAPPAVPQPPIDKSARPSSAASNPAPKPSESAPASSDGTEKAAVTVKEATPVEDGAKADTEATDKAEPQRPPIRPGEGVRSRFDQEPNPFEQSFSHPAPDDNTPPRGTDATSTRHNALPPLSSLTSPAAADPTQFPWLANQSLRAGPLSPAMLTGPQGQNQAQNGQRQADDSTNQPSEGAFEQSSFRTGFTPGTGTGFTPGYNSFINSSLSSLPIPSPNTTAFLNSITNVTPLGEGSEVAQAAAASAAAANAANHDHPHPPSAIPPHMQHHAPHHSSPSQSTPPNHPAQPPAVQETITPNTLTALSGVFGDMSRAPGAHTQAPPGFFPAPLPGQPPHHPGQIPGQAVPGGMPPYVDYAQHNANAASQAANGLFLLSQAHQELSKREEAEGSHSPVGANTRRGGRAVSQTGGVAGQKRKSDATGPATNGKAKKGKKGGKATAAEKETASEESDDGGSQGRGESGKFETEEDKRKNFLERNRQAALKCRQRKKAWLNELQSKVETLTIDNERLQQTVQQMHEEVGRLTAILMQHRDCGLGMPTGFGAHPGQHGHVGGHPHAHPGARLR